MVFAYPYWSQSRAPYSESKEVELHAWDKSDLAYRCGVGEHSYIDCLLKDSNFKKIASTPHTYHETLVEYLKKDIFSINEFHLLLHTMDSSGPLERLDFAQQALNIYHARSLKISEHKDPPYIEICDEFLEAYIVLPDPAMNLAFNWYFWHPKIRERISRISPACNHTQEALHKYLSGIYFQRMIESFWSVST